MNWEPVRISLVSIALMLSCLAEARDLKRILRAIEKGDYPKTIELIEESLAEVEVNPGVKYVLADLMTYDSLPIYNIDSARIRIREALDDYAVATYDDLEELSKNGIGIGNFEQLASKIESMHYDRALVDHQVAAFEEFMELYPLSTRVPTFVRLRDSLIWEGVRPQYELASYKGFLQNYPGSHLSDEVQVAYDSLLFYTSTASDRLEDYRSFLFQHPRTPYRPQIEEVIFRRMTASNDPSDLQAFIDNYDNPRLEARAYDIGYHIDRSFGLRLHPRLDSMRQVRRVDNRGMAPILVDGRYSFMNSLGAKVRGVSYDRIPEEYLCGDIKSDVLIGLGVNGGIFDRLGTKIYAGNVLEARDLGLGVLMVRGGGNRLIHKSGFTIMEGLDDAEVAGNQWLKVSKGKQYGLVSISGHQVTPFKYDDIWKEGVFWVFEKDDLLAVYTTEKIMEQLYDDVLELEFKFDDLEVYQDTLLIGFRGERECLLDRELDFQIPWGAHQVSPGSPYHFSRGEDGYRLFGIGPISSTPTFARLQDTDSWMAVQTDTSWALLNKSDLDLGFTAVDSVHLITNSNALIRQEEGSYLLFAQGDTLMVSDDDQLTAIIPLEPAAPSKFLLLSNKRQKKVFSTSGQLVFEGAYDEIKPLNDSLFVVRERGKQGVIDISGKQVVSQRYEALQVADGMITLLRDGKIGGYDLHRELAFGNKYEARLERVGRYYITSMNGDRGMIDRREDVVIPFAYDAIEAFNDTIYWLQEGSEWSLVNIRSDEPILEEVSRFRPIAGADGDRFILFYGTDGYGVINEQAEVILPPRFNTIQNVGNATDPIFFVEEYSETADFYVVTYVDREGERLSSFGYRPDEFQRVICDD